MWLAAVVPDFAGGASSVDEAGIRRAEMFNPEWTTLSEAPTEDPVTAAYFLFHDCDLATVRWALSTVRLFHRKAAYAEPSGAVVPAVPSTFVLPVEDRTPRPEWMRRRIGEWFPDAASDAHDAASGR
ncbi:hypothetical protein [Qaidamihabitans albus]|uniref:hypothetical protein n=1 Tax=Qaidamihabitans albus TaxID=2795733 RepID=UPI0018F243DA|nr:hypothetical protein [Qaidamihabitans albus]